MRANDVGSRCSSRWAWHRSAAAGVGKFLLAVLYFSCCTWPVEAEQPLDEMLKWMKEGGTTWDDTIEIRQISPRERGVVVKRPLPAGDKSRLIVVPLNRTLSGDFCKQNASSYVMKLPRRMRNMLGKSHSLLHLCFLEHYLVLKEQSPFAPYLRSLPPALDHLPLLTKLNLTSLLQGSPLLADITKHREDLTELYHELGWEIKSDFKERVSLDDFMRTYSMVESHSHARHYADQTMPLMVPFVDLINHRSRGESLKLAWGGAHEIVVMPKGVKAVAAGDQLFFCYSDETEASTKFFKQFGFVDENLLIGVRIQWSLSRHHPHYFEKRNMYEEHLVHAKTMHEQMFGKDDSYFNDYAESHPHMFEFPKFCHWLCRPAAEGFAPYHPPSLVRDELLPYARFVVWSGSMAAFNATCDTSTKPPLCPKPLAAEEEANAIELLQSTVSKQLADYGSSAEEDDHMLATLAEDSPERPYIRVRRDEKRCLLKLSEEIYKAANGVSAPDAPVSGADMSSIKVDAEGHTMQQRLRMHRSHELGGGPAFSRTGSPGPFFLVAFLFIGCGVKFLKPKTQRQED